MITYRTGRNLTESCKENNLQQSAFVMIMNGERKHHKNWTIKKLDLIQN